MISGSPTILVRDGLVGLDSADGTRAGLVVNKIGRLLVDIPSLTKVVTATAAANTAVTLTIPAAGVGFYHHISHLYIARTATAVLAGTATLVVTTTNLPGVLAWSFGNAMAAGATQTDYSENFPNPLRSLIDNTDTTIVAPAPGVAVLWRLTVFYEAKRLN